MMMVIAVMIALLAVFTGVLAAAFDLPEADQNPRTQRWSVVLLVAASVTAVAGATYALLA